MSNKASARAMSSQTLFGLNKNAVCYSFTTLAAAMMNTVFRFYYVNVFLNLYHIQEWWFQVAQVLFMVWNAVNDPLFGYFQDKYRSRQGAVRHGAILFAISFLIFWFPWTSDGANNPTIVGIHLIVSLFLYDALFTYVLLAQCAIFAEISKEHLDKVQLIKYSQVASIVGSLSVLVCNLVSNNLENYYGFQMTCIFIAVLSWMFLRFSGRNVVIEADTKSEPTADLEGDNYSYWSLTLQIMKGRNFISFVIVNLLTIFGSTFSSNFTAIICSHLVQEAAMSSTTKSMFYGSMFVLPQILVILGAPIVARVGYFRVIRVSFVVRIISAVLMLIAGAHNQWLLMIFIIADATNSDATFSLYNLPLSDIIEEDMAKYRRSAPVSSMVFGTNALITKPAQSLAPMFALWLLNLHGYSRLQHGETLAPAELDSLFSAMFYLVCLLPVVLGVLQYVTWTFFQLRNTHNTLYGLKYVDA